MSSLSLFGKTEVRLELTVWNGVPKLKSKVTLDRCPSADKWIRKLWYIYTMEYYSAIIKNSFESVLMR